MIREARREEGELRRSGTGREGSEEWPLLNDEQPAESASTQRAVRRTNPAASYSPARLPLKYHRRWRA